MGDKPQGRTVQPVKIVNPSTSPINVEIVGVLPGTVIAGAADTAIGAGATEPLPSPPAGTRRMTVQNTGPSGSAIRVRAVGDPAGSGILLFLGGSATYGGADGALADLEAQDVSSPSVGATVATQFEED